MSSITFVLKVVAPTAIGSNKTGTPASFAAFPASIIASVFSSLNVPKFKTSASAFAAISAASFGLLDIEGEAPMAINPLSEKLIPIIFLYIFPKFQNSAYAFGVNFSSFFGLLDKGREAPIEIYSFAEKLAATIFIIL